MRTHLTELAVLLAVVASAPVAAQDHSDAVEKQVVRELAGIQRSLADLVDLLETMRRNQDVDLVLRRIELHERRLAPLERSVRGNEQDQIDTRQQVSEAVMWKERTEDRILELEREGIEETPEDFRQQVEVAEGEIERLQLRLDGLLQRQIELENTVADGRDEFEILDDLLRELLE